MDSLSQIVLGAAVGEAVLGRKIGARAALWGALAGTVPDLDIFFHYTHSFIEAQDLHRGFSHSFTFSLLFAPLLALLMSRFHRKREIPYKSWFWLAFLGLVTHPLLDNFTTWGTEFFWPFSEYRVAFNSIFVIDPLWTIPFMIFLIWALFKKRENKWRKRLNFIGIGWAVSYLMIGVIAKSVMNSRFEESLAEQRIEYVDYMSKPAPMNIVLWSSTARADSGYYLGHASFLDETDAVNWTYFPHRHHLLDELRGAEQLETIIDFSKEYYIVEQGDTALILSDLRFGQLTFYPDLDADFVFNYIITKDAKTGEVIVSKGPQNLSGMGEAFAELWKRLKGAQDVPESP
jgi:inner membrane protein